MNFLNYTFVRMVDFYYNKKINRINPVYQVCLIITFHMQLYILGILSLLFKVQTSFYMAFQIGIPLLIINGWFYNEKRYAVLKDKLPNDSKLKKRLKGWLIFILIILSIAVWMGGMFYVKPKKNPDWVQKIYPSYSEMTK